MEKTIKIQGMTCGHCSARVEKMLKGLEGVSEVAVDLNQGTAKVTAAENVTDEQLREAVDDAGYDVTDING